MNRHEEITRMLIDYWHHSSPLVKSKYDACRQLADSVIKRLPDRVSINVRKNPEAYVLDIQSTLADLEQYDIVARQLMKILIPPQQPPSPLEDSKADVVILTVLQEEYDEICTQLSGLRSPNIGLIPDLYAWKFGYVYCRKFNDTYNVSVGMIGRAGTNQSALATDQAIRLWKPRYIFFSGIAGGINDPQKKHSMIKKGDIIIADVIYGYEYGKLDKNFKPRVTWTYRTDIGLLNGAIAYSRWNDWHKRIKVESPTKCEPTVIRGEIASGDKIIEDPTNEYFAKILGVLPSCKAVEMEGAGISSAIEQAHCLGNSVGFMMIRGISDLPRSDNGDETRGTEERDNWKRYASHTAASFLVGWIADGLPMRPSASITKRK